MSRIEKFRSLLPDGVDAAIVNSMIHRRYLLNFMSSAGTLFITREKAYLIIDSRYIEIAQKRVKDAEVILLKNEAAQLDELAKKHGVKTVGLETGYINLQVALKMQSYFTEAEVVFDDRVNDVLLRMREIKDEYELSCIRKAQEIADEAFTYICTRIAAGREETEVEYELLDFCRRQGASINGLICVAGTTTSLPHGHAEPGRVIQKGDFVTMDYCPQIDGYFTDMTRTVCVGEPSEEQRKIYDIVLEANTTCIAAVKAGASCSEIDGMARKIIYGAGYEGCFGHGLGHTLGLEIHEWPRFAGNSTRVLEAGMPITVEPGIYLPGKFGCRIEDTVVVTEDGCIDLAHSTKELVIL